MLELLATATPPPTGTPLPVTDLWGVAVPAWVGAIGSVLTSVLAVLAFFGSVRANRSARTIADGLNSTGTLEPVEARGEVTLGGTAEVTVVHPWSFTVRGQRAVFRNTSTQPVTLDEVSGTGGLLATGPSTPFEVPADASFNVALMRTMTGGGVRGVTLKWTREDGQSLERVYYL